MSLLIAETIDGLDANRIETDLWQGSCPPRGPLLAYEGFTLVVLCSSEYQPPAQNFPGLKVIHAPFEDDLRAAPTTATLRLARDTAVVVKQHLDEGLGPVLISCFAGLNRSGLVMGLVLRMLGYKPAAAVRHIQLMRESALFNQHFVEAVLNLPLP